MASHALWDKHRTYVPALPERTLDSAGRLVVPAAGQAEDMARLGLVLDVLHKRPLGGPPGTYGWGDTMPSTVHGMDVRVTHDLDVPMDLTWLRANTDLPDDITLYDPASGVLGGARQITCGTNPAGGPAFVIRSVFDPSDPAWSDAGWREGEPWDGDRPLVRGLADRVAGRPGRQIPPFSSDPDWSSA